ncbi:cell wall-binding repeat-containing protein [Clostridium magnum]|uniref:N-acetylmuramoyl-L-alanine amidase LytC n=1 Tax=Clostridium magnum DSM 2767 TaxID=1121326 RepID=A0A161YIK6_9CLOT|nr:cell wall-binding repeat-containing protein [Clostridium magnum]KZL90202.1 N-acetylmuramoyl-L-alanine amidase LytC precursor [Clostridium magnum DSM 2767]SHH64345.1 Putative cell wall binding repeat 2 [Clostridium magnum DSM 2767]
MSKKGTRALASATLMSLVLTSALAAGPVKAAAGEVTRTSGADRYATAAQVAKANWATGATDVVLVTGEGYADAVSASALAKQLNAPILLTTTNELSNDAKLALETLKPQNVYIVGGNAAISQSVRDGLKANYNLVELGGKNRYETNVAVANKLVELGVKADSVMLVGGEGFSDALSVAPVAAAKGQILLLGSNNTETMAPVINFVNANSSKVTVVGTTNIINEDMYKALNAVDRVNGGANRFETNMNVLNKYAADLKADKLFVANASGNGYADALVASALAGKTASPLVLVDSEGAAATTTAINYIKAKATKTTDLNVVGGEGVVSNTTVNAINSAVNGDVVETPSATVASVTATNLNQIKVVFNSEVDEDSAELVSNYKIDGTALNSGNAKASLQDDNKTLVINLYNVKQQNKSYDFEVKDGVLTADKTETVAKYGSTVTFSDITAPTVTSVSVKGNSKITVMFSEPVKVDVDASGNATSTFTSKLKINGQNISGFGLSTAAPKDVVAAVTAGTTTSTTVWADGVDLYFASKLPSGNNTLKISDGDANSVLSDAAGFVFKEATQNFNVDAVTTAPVIKEVKADADGTLWVRFDRAMDQTTATSGANYGLNGDSNSLSAGTLKEGDATVKFTGVSFATGANTLYIKNSIKDAYGNKVADDTRISFTNTKDETKPTVTKVTMIDSSTIRMTFSKDIDMTYASKTTNYTLKDSTGSDITSNIDYVKPSNGVMANDNVWDIKMKAGDSNKLTGSKYTLTIKNLVDTTTNKNVMDEYTTTLTGNDDVAPKLSSVVAKADGANHKVVLFFSEAMDTDTLSNLANYKYQNASNETNSMPSATKITVSNDNKSVTLEFPSNYYVQATSGVDNDNIVDEILVSGLKDEAGNLIDSFANSGAITPVSGASTVAYKANTYKVEDDGNDLLVKFQFDKSIDTDTLDRNQFTVAGETPDSVSVNGSDIVLRFSQDVKGVTTAAAVTAYDNNPVYTDTNLDKIEAIKAQGSAAQLVLATNTLKDLAGAAIAPTTLASTVYNYTAAPKTTSDFWYATAGSTESTVVITFDNVIDSHSGVKTDDYTFVIDGESVKADAVQIVDNTLVFKFNTADKATKFVATNKVGVALKNTAINVETLKDADGNYAKYVPSTDDTTKTRQVVIH